MNAEKRTDDDARQDVSETLASLEVDAARRLSDAGVRQRRTRYGYNEVEEKGEPLWHRVFHRFPGTDPTPHAVRRTSSSPPRARASSTRQRNRRASSSSA